MMSLKNVNAITHYTDYVIAHVHVGALGWNGGLTFAMLYYIVPRIYGTTLFSVRLANTHFWLLTLGVLFYSIPLYIAGITQALMWKEFTADGALRYGNFLETVVRILPMYWLRIGGGTIFLIGAVLCLYNLYKTAASGVFQPGEAAQAAPLRALPPTPGAKAWHRVLEGRPTQFAVLTFVAVVIGGVVEYVPTALIRANIPTIATVQPYTPLEIEGRDLYIREGCLGCHSQMIRPMRAETERYGDYSKPGEFVYDHPFLWGSRRIGPDLARVGGKYPDLWHVRHFQEPKALVQNSIMPGYGHLERRALDFDGIQARVDAMVMLGVPYGDAVNRAPAMAREQASAMGAGIEAAGGPAGLADREVISLIAYLQRLGKDIKQAPAATAMAVPAGAGGLP